jgi:AcrR family transcriptional regulator
VAGSELSSILTPSERRLRNRQEMHSAILEASRAVMRERGVAALSLREVARRVRLQAPSLYAYFPSKLALYQGLFLEAVRRFGTYKERSARRTGSFWDHLETSFTTYMQFAQEQPDLHQLAFERPVPGFSPSEESMAESAATLSGLTDTLEQAIQEGAIRPHVSLTQARDLIIAMSHGLTSQHMANEPDLPIGSGRYGSLIPAALELFRLAWDPNQKASSSEHKEVSEPAP